MGEAEPPDATPGPGIVTALSKALQNFGHLPFGGGALAQAWMPFKPSEETPLVLQTKGLPYSIIGPGDMLALFRCLSCKYSFSASLKQMGTLGSPGRVFVTGEAETSDDVQQCNMSIYLRVKDARACKISTTVLLPIFPNLGRGRAVAVLEVTQFSGTGTSYQNLFDWARNHLEREGLYLPQQLETRTFEMQSHALSIRFFSSRDTALGCLFNSSNDGGAAGAVSQPTNREAGDSGAAAGGGGGEDSVKPLAPSDETPATDAQKQSDDAPSEGNRRSSAEASDEAGDGVDSPSKDEQQPTQDDESWEPQPGSAGGGASGSQAKTGLTREDLEKHFGYGLKEAAARLGVCNTTLKRACRRHGIMKWPRRELLRNAKMKRDASAKVIEAPEIMQPSSQPMQPEAALHVSTISGGVSSPGSTSGARPQPQAFTGFGGPPRGLQPSGSSNYLPEAFPSQTFYADQQRLAAMTRLQQRPQMPSVPLTGFQQPSVVVSEPQHMQWFFAGSPQQVGAAVQQRPATSFAPAGSGSNRGPLAFVDSIFGETEGELHSMLGEWEEQLEAMQQDDAPPQAMHVVSQAIATGTDVPTSMPEGGFPEDLDPWPIN